MKPKYNLGDTVYWVYSSNHYSKKIPCPICFGKKHVQVILGDDSIVKSECGYCSHGLDRATGTATTWEPYAQIRSGEIDGIENYQGWTYKAGGSTHKEHELFSSEEEATPKYKDELLNVQKQAKHFFEESFVNATKEQMWSAGYHRECIKRAQQTIEWHEGRLCIIKQPRHRRKRIRV